MNNEIIVAVSKGLDILALLIFFGLGIFSVLKPEKAWKFVTSKKNKATTKTDNTTSKVGKTTNKASKTNNSNIKANKAKEPYMRMKIYGLILIIVSCVGILEMFI